MHFPLIDNWKYQKIYVLKSLIPIATSRQILPYQESMHLKIPVRWNTLAEYHHNKKWRQIKHENPIKKLLRIIMRILSSFERNQISKVLSADFNGTIHCRTYNYLIDLQYFKHLCHCGPCNLLNINISQKMDKIKRDIDLAKLHDIVVPLEISQEISFVLALFEQFHIDPAVSNAIHRNWL